MIIKTKLKILVNKKKMILTPTAPNLKSIALCWILSDNLPINGGNTNDVNI